MKNPMGQTNELVDHLINSVVQKLQANREIPITLGELRTTGLAPQ